VMSRRLEEDRGERTSDGYNKRASTADMPDNNYHAVINNA
jgi:hypothetical protein